MKIKAYSKINFGLKVYKKKYMGKHKIDSFFYKNKKIFDVITINESEKLSIKYFHNKKRIYIKNDILIKTIKFFEKRFNLKINLSIEVDKNIPVGSGLGGSATCAAELIKYISKKFKIKKINYEEIAIFLGSDIPFFLSNYSCAKVSGVGEIVIKEKPFLKNYEIFIPKIKCISKKVFDCFDKMNNKKETNLSLIKKNFNKLNNNIIINDLQQSAFSIYKQLKENFYILSTKYKFVTISGSGSSFVCIKRR